MFTKSPDFLYAIFNIISKSLKYSIVNIRPQSVGDQASMVVGESHSLASLQLLQMKLAVSVLSNQEMELEASLKDMALLDQQPDQQGKKTGSVCTPQLPNEACVY